MNTEEDEFARIEREQAMRAVPDLIHHTDTSETLEYIQGWNDCRQAMLAEQPAQRTWVHLTNQEHDEISIECGCLSADWVFYGAVLERKIKEKNTI